MAKTTIELRIKLSADEDVQSEVPRFYRFFKEHDITVLKEIHNEQTVIFTIDSNSQFIDSLTDLVDIEELGIESAELEIDLKPITPENP